MLEECRHPFDARGHSSFGEGDNNAASDGQPTVTIMSFISILLREWSITLSTFTKKIIN